MFQQQEEIYLQKVLKNSLAVAKIDIFICIKKRDLSKHKVQYLDDL